MNKDILELFREYSELNSTRISDSVVLNDLIPRSLEFMKLIIQNEDVGIENNTTGDLIYDSALAQLASYFAYLTLFRKVVDRRTNLYNYEVHYQEALSILYVKAPRRIVFDDKNGIYRVINFQRTHYITMGCKN